MNLKCAECDYDLRGHDATSKCPECGLCYDLSLLQIRARPRSALIEYALHNYSITVVGSVILLAAWLSLQMNSPLSTANFLALIIIAGIVAGGPIIVLRQAFRNRCSKVMTITSDGLVFSRIENPNHQRVWQWRRLSSAQRWRKPFGSPCIRILYRGIACFFTGGLFVDLDVSPAQADIIFKAIRQRLGKG